MQSLLPRRMTLLAAALLVAGLLFAASTPRASALDPTGLLAPEVPEYWEWTEELPPLPVGYNPTLGNLCVAGQDRCVDAVVREMERRLRPLDTSCDHNAVFALLYLHTTRVYQQAVAEPGFFADPAFLNHYDTTFGAYYFLAEDAWKAGRTADVPPAWQIAFDAGRDQEVSGLGNALLGLSAHINRDLPFVLAEIALRAPDGTSRKPDHDKVNEFLARVNLNPVAQRYDPTIGESADEPTLADIAAFEVVPTWREEAWRNAERLIAARTPLERRLVAQSIEQRAAAINRGLLTATSYTDDRAREARNDFCHAYDGPRVY